jgi:pentatricopeptide repeat protein
MCWPKSRGAVRDRAIERKRFDDGLWCVFFSHLQLFLTRGTTKSGAAASIQLFNALLFTFQKDVHTCQKLFAEMCAASTTTTTPSSSSAANEEEARPPIEPNAETYAAMIRAHAAAGDMSGAEQYYRLGCARFAVPTVGLSPALGGGSGSGEVELTGDALMRYSRLTVAMIEAHLHANDLERADAMFWSAKPDLHMPV